MNRKKYVLGNLKMNLTQQSLRNLLEGVSSYIQNSPPPSSWQVGMAPVAIHLPLALPFQSSNFQLLAQNCAAYEKGAYTGEVSTEQLADLGVSGTIVGHSERREYFHENDIIIREKIKLALGNKLKVVYCCGENLAERKISIHEEVVGLQIRTAFSELTADHLENIIIAYEPVWAIGTGETATPQQAQEMHHFIRNTVADLFGKQVAQQIAILYGGSVKPDNAAELFAQPDVDGALVGGAALKSDSFNAIIQATH
ncbi:MAG: triose-phosphate isomerase [Chitinophagales bacterium]|nr:triose-phosphate isomerase [Bacteroidota bacterium]